MKNGTRIAYKPSWLKEIKASPLDFDLWNRKGIYIGPGKTYGKMKMVTVKWDDAPDNHKVNQKIIVEIGSTEFVNTDLK